jgi:hypothetical protein
MNPLSSRVINLKATIEIKNGSRQASKRGLDAFVSHFVTKGERE